MNDTDKTPQSPAHGRFGATPIYILAAVLAAIAGFGVFSFLYPPRTVVTQAVGPAVERQTEKANGLDRLVHVSPPNALGAIAFTDGEGRARSLSEWRGKIVLVNLWATWCAPCKREMPSLDRLEAKFGGAEFAVLPISFDRNGPEKPREFLASNGLTKLGLFLDGANTLMQALRVPGLPLSILLDRQGREIARLAGPAEWDGPEAEKLIRAAIANSGDG
jgi:thiol-disulfide isomerase/thioredoxin